MRMGLTLSGITRDERATPCTLEQPVTPARQRRGRAGHAPASSYSAARCGRENHGMKVLFWIIAVIFLIGLLVVFGLGSLIF